MTIPVRQLRPALLGIMALLVGASCRRLNDLLAVDPTKSIPAEAADTPDHAQLLIDGAKSDFDCAFGAYVVLGGMIGEELDDTRQDGARRPYDLRIQTSKDLLYATQPCGNLGVYTPLQVARASAERTLVLLRRWTDDEVPNRQLGMATMSAYAGYSTLLLAEGFCTTVLSLPDDQLNIVWGGEISRDSALRVAETRFGAALAMAQPLGAATILDLAHAGRARARADRGDLVNARLDAQAVSPAFVYQITASATSPRRTNRAFAQGSIANANHLTSVSALYRALADPRVPFADAHDVSAWGTAIFVQTKYTGAGSPFRLASATEARLITAEADIATGTAASLQNAQNTLNAFRAVGKQSALTSLDADTLRAALIDQRRREFFLESQHLSDLIRFGIKPTPLAGSPHPSGLLYGSQLCLPLPDVERDNNPVLAGNSIR
jgi:hypothetical protein